MLKCMIWYCAVKNHIKRSTARAAGLCTRHQLARAANGGASVDQTDVTIRPVAAEMEQKMDHEYLYEDLEITLARIKKKKLEAYLKVARLEAELAETEDFIIRKRTEIGNKKINVQKDTKAQSTVSIDNTDPFKDTDAGVDNAKSKKTPEKSSIIKRKHFNVSHETISKDVCRYCYKGHEFGDCKIFNKLMTEESSDVKKLRRGIALNNHPAEEKENLTEKYKSCENHRSRLSCIEVSACTKKEVAYNKTTDFDQKSNDSLIRNKFKDRNKRHLSGKRENRKQSKRNKTAHGYEFKEVHRQELKTDMQDVGSHSTKLSNGKVEKTENHSNGVKEFILEPCFESGKTEDKGFDSMLNRELPNGYAKVLERAREEKNVQNHMQMTHAADRSKCNHEDCIVCMAGKEYEERCMDDVEKKKNSRLEVLDETLGTVRRAEIVKRDQKNKKNCCLNFHKNDSNKENKLNEANSITKKDNHCRLSQICSLLYPNMRR